MPPLSLSDLDPMNGRIAAQFSDVIDECNPILRDWEHSNFDGLKTTSTKYGHGFYFRAFSFSAFLAINSENWFVKHNHAPIWLRITDQDFKISEKINNALSEYDSDNSFGNEYGIVLNTGMDKDQLVQFIVKKTKDVVQYLNTKL